MIGLDYSSYRITLAEGTENHMTGKTLKLKIPRKAKEAGSSFKSQPLVIFGFFGHVAV